MSRGRDGSGHHATCEVSTSFSFEGDIRGIEVVDSNTIWTVNHDGSLSIRNAAGRETHSVDRKYRVFCNAILLVDNHIWAGLSDGFVRVFDLQGNVLKEMLQHDGAIHCLTEAEGKVYTGGEDWKIYQWNPLKCEYTRLFFGHMHTVRAIVSAKTTQMSLIFSASDDATIRVWNPQTPQYQSVDKDLACLATLKGHTKSVQCLEVVDDRRQLWSGGEEGVIRVWSVDSLQCITTLDGHRSPVTSLRHVANAVWSAGKDGVLTLWNTSNYGALQQISNEGPGHFYTAMIKRIAKSYFWKIWTCRTDGIVKCWNSEGGASLDPMDNSPEGQSMERRLTVMHEALQEQAAKLSAKDEELVEMRQRVAVLLDSHHEGTVAALQETIDDLTIECSNYKHNVDSLELRCSMAEDLLIATRRHLGESESRASEFSRQIDELQNQPAEAVVALQAATEQLQTSNEECRRLRKLVEEQDVLLADQLRIVQDNEKLQDRVHVLQVELDRSGELAESKVQEKERAIVADLEQLKAEKRELDELLKSLVIEKNNSIEILKEEVSQLRTLLDEQEAKSHSLSEQNAKMADAVRIQEEMTVKLREQDDELRALQANHAQHRSRTDLRIVELEEHTTFLERELSNQKTTASRETAAAQQLCEQMEKELTEKERTIGQLRSEAKRVRSENDQLQRQLTVSEVELKDLKREAEGSGKRASTAAKEAQERSEEARHLQVQLSEKSRELDIAVEQVRAEVSCKEDLMVERDELLKKLRAGEAASSGPQSQKTSTDRELAPTQRSEVTAEGAETQSDSQREVGKLKDQVRGLQDERRTLQKKLDLANQSIEAFKKAQEEQLCEQMEKELTEKERTIGQLRSEAKKLRTENDQQQRQLTVSEVELKDLKREAEDAGKRASTAAKEAQGRGEEARHLQVQLSEKSQELDIAVEQIRAEVSCKEDLMVERDELLKKLRAGEAASSGPQSQKTSTDRELAPTQRSEVTAEGAETQSDSQREVGKLKDQVRGLQDERRTLQKKLDLANQSIEAFKKAQEEQLQLQCAEKKELEVLLDAAQSTAEQRDAEVQGLRRQLLEMPQKSEELEVAALRNRVKELEELSTARGSEAQVAERGAAQDEKQVHSSGSGSRSREISGGTEEGAPTGSSAGANSQSQLLAMLAESQATVNEQARIQGEMSAAREAATMRVAVLEKQLEDARIALADSQRKCEELTERAGTAEKKLSKATKQLNELETITNELVAISQEETSSKSRATQEEVSALRKRVKELEEGSQSQSQLLAMLAESQATVNDQARIQNEMSAAREAAAGRIVVLEKQLDDAQTALADAQRKCEELQICVAEMSDKLAEIDTVSTSLRSEVADAASRAEAAEKKAADVASEATELKARADVSAESLKQAEVRLTESDTSIAELTAALERETKECLRLQEDLEVARESESKLQASTTEQLATLQRQLQDSQSAEETLRKELEVLRHDITSVNKDNEQLEKRAVNAAELGTKLQAAQQEIDGLIVEVETFREKGDATQHIRTSAELRVQLSSSESERLRLEQALISQRAETQCAKNKLDEVQHKIDADREALAAEQSEREKLMEKVGRLQSELRSAEFAAAQQQSEKDAAILQQTKVELIIPREPCDAGDKQLVVDQAALIAKLQEIHSMDSSQLQVALRGRESEQVAEDPVRLTAELDSLSAALHAAEQKEKTFAAENSELRSRLDILENTMGSPAGRGEQQESSPSRTSQAPLSSYLAHLSRLLERKSDAVALWQQQALAKDAAIRSLQSKLGAYVASDTSDVASQRLLNTLVAENLEGTATTVELNATLSALRNSNASLRQQLREASLFRDGVTPPDLSGQTRLLINHLNGVLKDTRAEKEAVRQQLLHKDAVVASLSRELFVARRQMESAGTDSTQQSLVAALAESRKQSEKIRALEEKIGLLTATIGKMSGEVATPSAEAPLAILQRLDETQELLADRQAMQSIMLQDANSMRMEMQRTQEEHAKVVAMLQKVEQTVAEQQGAMQSLEAELSNSQSELQSLQTAFNKLKADSERFSAQEFAAMETVLTERNRELAQTKAQITALGEAAKLRETDIANLRGELETAIAEREAAMQRSRGHAKSIEEALANSNIERDSLKSQLARSCAEAQREHENAETQRQNATTARDALTRREEGAAAMAREIESLLQRLRTLEESQVEAEKEKVFALERLEVFEMRRATERRQEEEDLTAARRSATESAGRLLDAESSADASGRRVRALEAELNDLREDKQSLNRRLALSQELNSQLESQIEALEGVQTTAVETARDSASQAEAMRWSSLCTALGLPLHSHELSGEDYFNAVLAWDDRHRAQSETLRHVLSSVRTAIDFLLHLPSQSEDSRAIATTESSEEVVAALSSTATELLTVAKQHCDKLNDANVKNSSLRARLLSLVDANRRTSDELEVKTAEVDRLAKRAENQNVEFLIEKRPLLVDTLWIAYENLQSAFVALNSHNGRVRKLKETSSRSYREMVPDLNTVISSLTEVNNRLRFSILDGFTPEEKLKLGCTQGNPSMIEWEGASGGAPAEDPAPPVPFPRRVVGVSSPDHSGGAVPDWKYLEEQCRRLEKQEVRNR